MGNRTPKTTIRPLTGFAGGVLQDSPDIDQRARQAPLPDRAQAGLIVTTPRGVAHIGRMTDLPRFLPAGSVMVLDVSGMFYPVAPDTRFPDGSTQTIHFGQMLDNTGNDWIVVVPGKAQAGDILKLSGPARLQLIRPYMVGTTQARWTTDYRDRGKLWIARYQSSWPFATYHREFNGPVTYYYDRGTWSYVDYQNCYSTRPTSALMNNGGYNLTDALLAKLRGQGVQVVDLELRTSLGTDAEGNPLPEFYYLPEETAAVVNRALAEGRPVLPVGTSVVRALDWCYNRQTRRLGYGSGWCTNLIAPDRGGTSWNAWLSGLHEDGASHLAMACAVIRSEQLVTTAMRAAHQSGLHFHEHGDTHLHLP